jgi:hypothetical protein
MRISARLIALARDVKRAHLERDAQLGTMIRDGHSHPAKFLHVFDR